MSCMNNHDKMDQDCNTSLINLSMNISESDNGVQALVSDDVLWWIRMVINGFVCQAVAVFGTIANIINFVVFIKLGLKDPMNVTLLGLAISDFISCFAQMWFNLCLNPFFMELDLPFQPVGAHYLFGAWPHLCATKITIAITAFITLQRCLCVAYPLKVKEMITTKRVAIVVVFIYALMIGLTAPVYDVNRYAWVFYPERNRSLYSLVFTANREKIEPPLFFFLGVFFPVSSFIITVVSTSVLVTLLKKNAKWRQEATGKSTTETSSSATPSAQNVMSSRDTKVTKMVVTISTLFIISACPVMISTILMLLDPELKEGGEQVNMLHAIFTINYLFETLNASFNIVIYYNMSSNYKSMFQTMFNIKGGDQK